VTGNLADATGRQFGYQLTLFRIALSPTPPVADSAWRTNQVYMGHFALTDVVGEHGIIASSVSAGARWVWRARKRHHFESGWKIGR
jgi:predicted secreted hydrolase